MTQHAAEHDHHGKSLAAWALVGIVCFGSLIIAIGFVVPSMALIVVGTIVAILGLVVGRVLALRGHGVRPATKRAPVEL